MIKYVFINNYKSFVNFRIDFEKNNLLLGGNGTGKSNLILLIYRLCSFIKDNRNETGLAFSINSRTRWMESNIQTFELGLESNGIEYIYHLEIEHNPEKVQSIVLNETVKKSDIVLVEAKAGQALLFNDLTGTNDIMMTNTFSSIVSYINNDKRYKSILEFKNCIERIVYCVPNPGQMSYIVENNIYSPTPNMSNIASLYTGLVEIIPEFQNDFTMAMKEINPNYVGAGSFFESNQKCFSVIYKYKDVKNSFRFDELSDGEKELFALYLILYGYLKQGYTILLDEPDNYLGLREIQPWCMELEDILFENGQSIMISHHPEIIDYFTDGSGIWLSRLQSGESVVRQNPFTVPEDGKILSYSELIARGLDEDK
ncbi:MAG: ATP-binding protein [Lachnospiraceae bacterium]|nr:ATP-binding protein [Lachnospiraceae bacterium]